MEKISSVISTTLTTGFGYARISALTETLLERYGVNTMVLIITAILVVLSVLLSSLALIEFQGYVDMLGIGISFSAPSILVPPPAKLILSMFARLKKTEAELRMQNIELEKTLGQVKTLSGLLPICCSCKKIRDDEGYWNEIEQYISDHSDLQLSHGICPECVGHLYPELYPELQDQDT